MSTDPKRFRVADDSLYRSAYQDKDGAVLRTTTGAGRRFLVRTNDTVLHAEPGAFNPAMMGKVWAGVFSKQLGGLSANDRRAALDSFRRALDSYEQGAATSEMGSGPSGSFSTGGQAERPEKEFAVNSPQAVDAQNKRFWRDKGPRDCTTHDAPVPVPRGDAGHMCAEMNAAARQLWADVQPARLGREYGKG